MPATKRAVQNAAKTAPQSRANFAGAYAELQKMLATYEKDFSVAPNKKGRYWLETKCAVYRGKPLLFAGVSLNKSYVSYYLMPIYVRPALAKDISPELQKRRQGKCCFNFAAPDAALFEELSRLTRTGFACYQEKKFLSGIDAVRKAGSRKKTAAGAR